MANRVGAHGFVLPGSAENMENTGRTWRLRVVAAASVESASAAQLGTRSP